MKVSSETGMGNWNALHLPMNPGLKLSKSSEEEGVNEKEYRKNSGCLRYLIHTRPDLSFAVGVLRRYMQAPK